MASLHIKGFTLIESLITLTIFLIVMVFATAVSYSWLWHYRSENDVQMLIHFIEQARITAQNMGQRVRLCPASDSDICGEDWRAGIILQTQNKILYRSSSFSKNAEIIYNRKTLDFDGNGFSQSSNGTFIYRPPQYSRINPIKIIVNRAGRVRVEK